LVAEHAAKGTLRRGDSPYVPPPVEPTDLRFPAKALVFAFFMGTLLLPLEVVERRSREAPSPVERLLAARGYEPYRDGAALRLRNCPFANLSGEFPVLVCAMNLSLIEGLLEGLGEPAGRAAMDPAPGRCCVAITSKDNQD
jgi:hypothetical protein